MVPSWFTRNAICIHNNESSHCWNYGPNDTCGYGAWNGYYGGLQFTLGTWQSVHGLGLPSFATQREQIYRAFLVWKRDGNSWREWPNSRKACGLR